MPDINCPETLSLSVVVTSQSDVDEIFSGPCGDQLDVLIQNATGTLNFMNLTTAHSIRVYDNPLLKVLNFPLLKHSIAFTVVRAQSLLTISLPSLLSNTADKADSNGLNLNITGAPSLTQLNIPNVTGIQDLNVVDVNFDDSAFSKVMAIGSLHADSCLDLASLASIDSLWVQPEDPSRCSLILAELTSTGDITLRDIHSLNFASKPLTVHGSLVLDNMTPLPLTPFPLAPTIDMGQVISIGLNASIASNANTTLNFGNLTTVGKSISVMNNTDCTIDLDRLIRVGNLSILDNINTTLPTFPALERAENIHLRGYINTSTEHNIFPALLRATGTVFIEPWNDFNCSKLVSQQQNGIIASLICDGTDNSTLTATAQPNVTPSAPPARLSKGAWAGIGIGIGVFTIGSIIAIACCTMYLRRLLKDVQLVKVLRANLNSPQEGPHQQHVEGWHEADGQGILREKPDDHIREIYVPPVEMLDDQVPAVQSSPVELPGGSPISQKLAVTK